MMSPCKYCDSRHPGCHGDCEVYKGWAEERRAATLQTKQNNAALNAMFDYGGKWKKGRYRKK